MDVEFAEDALDVYADRLRAYEQQRGDLPVGVSLRQLLQDLQLPGSEAR
jgi:hypothetical protein